MTKSSIRLQSEPFARFATAPLCVRRSRTISDFGMLRALAALAISANSPSATLTVRVFIWRGTTAFPLRPSPNLRSNRSWRTKPLACVRSPRQTKENAIASILHPSPPQSLRRRSTTVFRCRPFLARQSESIALSPASCRRRGAWPGLSH